MRASTSGPQRPLSMSPPGSEGARLRVDHSAGHVTVQMLVLGLVPISIGLVTDTLWGLTASAAGGRNRDHLRTTPKRMSYDVSGCITLSIRSPSAVTSSRWVLVSRSKGSITSASSSSRHSPARKPSTRSVG